MFDDPEKQLEQFLVSIPEWMRRFFQNGYRALVESEVVVLMDSSDLQRLQSEYESILQQMPTRWKEYRNRRKREFVGAILPMIVPQGKPGRKLNAKLAERIWALDAARKTNREIQEILNASGENLSLEGVEYYLKRRRRPPTQ